QFQKTCNELKGITDKAIWVHLETQRPQTLSAESLGAKSDMVRHRHGTILFQEGDGKDAKHNWLQTGEMIQVGKAWRIIEAPIQRTQPPPPEPPKPGTGTEAVVVPDGGQTIVDALNKLQGEGPGGQEKSKIIAFNLKQAGLLEQLVALFKKAEE